MEEADKRGSQVEEVNTLGGNYIFEAKVLVNLYHQCLSDSVRFGAALCQFAYFGFSPLP